MAKRRAEESEAVTAIREFNAYLEVLEKAFGRPMNTKERRAIITASVRNGRLAGNAWDEQQRRQSAPRAVRLRE